MGQLLQVSAIAAYLLNPAVTNVSGENPTSSDVQQPLLLGTISSSRQPGSRDCRSTTRRTWRWAGRSIMMTRKACD